MFERLQELVTSRVLNDYNGRPLLQLVFNYLVELYRKLNIKTTLAGVFLRIREVRTQIDANIFSINYSKQSIEVKGEELKMQQARIAQLVAAGARLSKKIEEAEISHMRTQQVFEKIQQYAAHLDRKLASVSSRTQSILGDAILLATSVVYLGAFAPEERESVRGQIFEYLTKVRSIKCNKMWTDYGASSSSGVQPTTATPVKSMFI